MTRPLWFVKLLKKSFPNIKFIAKLTRLPIIGRLFEMIMFEGDDITYLTQDKLIKIDKTINKQDEYVLPSQVIKYFIKKAKHLWIMDFCICRSSMNCQDYPIELGCLFLGEATLGINPLLGKKVSQQEALEHVRKCQEAGLVHMIGRNLLDKQWLGVDPGNKLMSICNCCPCCCLWRVAPIVNPKIGSKVHKMPGVEVRVGDECIGCGTCTEEICFTDAIHIIGKKAVINDECRGCGRCVEICPQNAIKLSINDKEYINKTIKLLESLVDVT